MKELILKTKDKVDIAINYYTNAHDEVVIVAPGWCMTKDSDAFVRISEMFAKQYDVISFDFRGHGKSGGLYTFMAHEIIDMDAVVRFARKNNYKKIYLVGFSLGAGIAVIYGAKSIFIDKVIAISVPADFDKIENQMWKKEAFIPTFKKFELKRWLSVRPSVIIRDKIKPIDIVDKITVPTLFLAGKKDPTVHFWHTKKLYEKAVCKKQFELFENGIHAEDLYLDEPERFTNLCLNFLKSQDA